MRSSHLAGMSAALLLFCGCQSTSWIAKNKKSSESAVAENKVVREVPWSEWRKKKGKSDDKPGLPPELQAKLDNANGAGNSTKTAAEWVAEGNQLEVDRNFAAATKAYEAALLIDPVHADAHHRLGIMADMRQEYGTARDHYEAALRKKPQDANLLSDFGYSMHLQGKAQQSERYLLQSLDLEPQHKQALKNLVTLYATQNRYEDAAQVCRRLRPEAEAQRLLAQGFPKGRPIPDNEQVELASGRNARAGQGSPSSPTAVADSSLKNKSAEEVYQLMAQQRQAGIQARQQKSLQEFRPEIQQSMTQEEWERSQAATVAPSSSQQAWAQNTSPADRQGSVPPGLESSLRQQPSAESHVTDASAMAPFPRDDTPLWNGAPLKPQVAASAERMNSRPLPPWATEDPNGSGPAADENSLALNDPRNDVASRGSSFATQTSRPLAAPPSHRMPNGTQVSANQRAYQLGMSAGPGTMFPVMPADGAAGWRNERADIAQPALDQQPVNVNDPANFSGPPQWSNSTTPSGYSETRVASPSEAATGPSESQQWQMAPVDVGPRSPTENWNSPSTVPWPERAAMKPEGELPSRRSASPQLPRIIPGKLNSLQSGSESSPASFPSGFDRGAAQQPNVVPAWFDSPGPERRAASRPTNATDLQQWPYAPQ